MRNPRTCCSILFSERERWIRLYQPTSRVLLLLVPLNLGTKTQTSTAHRWQTARGSGTLIAVLQCLLKVDSWLISNGHKMKLCKEWCSLEPEGAEPLNKWRQFKVCLCVDRMNVVPRNLSQPRGSEGNLEEIEPAKLRDQNTPGNWSCPLGWESHMMK